MIYGLVFIGILQYTLWFYMNDWNRGVLLQGLYAWVVILSLYTYFISRRDYYGFAIIGFWVFMFTMITLVMSFLALQLDPLVLRQSGNPAEFTRQQAYIFEKTGAGGYGFLQSLAILCPIIIYYIKQGGVYFFLGNL